MTKGQRDRAIVALARKLMTKFQLFWIDVQAVLYSRESEVRGLSVPL